ncbi:MAG TPA: XRE family transcriptional regulator [Streptosporangiaceae bacterium]|nr:XRE family transcriptional regulator [Streptosporangiaceae bacterium]
MESVQGDDGTKLTGRNVHRLRTSAGRSLADLASAAGVSKTTLHGLEQGEGNPTLSTLWALASALGVSLGELLEPPAPPVAVTRAGEGPRADGAAVHARLLHRIPVRGAVEVYEIEVDGTEQPSAAHLPGVEECMIITEGGVRTGPAGGPVDLAAGDSVHFGAATPHVYRGLGARNRAVLLMVHPAPRG